MSREFFRLIILEWGVVVSSDGYMAVPGLSFWWYLNVHDPTSLAATPFGCKIACNQIVMKTHLIGTIWELETYLWHSEYYECCLKKVKPIVSRGHQHFLLCDMWLSCVFYIFSTYLLFIENSIKIPWLYRRLDVGSDKKKWYLGFLGPSRKLKISSNIVI